MKIPLKTCVSMKEYTFTICVACAWIVIGYFLFKKQTFNGLWKFSYWYKNIIFHGRLIVILYLFQWWGSVDFKKTDPYIHIIKHFMFVLKISKTFVFFLRTSGEYSKKHIQGSFISTDLWKRILFHNIT